MLHRYTHKDAHKEFHFSAMIEQTRVLIQNSELIVMNFDLWVDVNCRWYLWTHTIYDWKLNYEPETLQKHDIDRKKKLTQDHLDLTLKLKWWLWHLNQLLCFQMLRRPLCKKDEERYFDALWKFLEDLIIFISKRIHREFHSRYCSPYTATGNRKMENLFK